MKDVLANLLSLQQEMREIHTLNELAFFIAHQTKLVAEYQRAIVWNSWQNKNIKILSVSGITQLNGTSPYQISANQFISKIITHYDQSKDLLILNIDDVAEAVATRWLEPLAKYAHIYFFRNLNKDIIGGVILLNPDMLNENELKQFDWISLSYNQAWSHLSKPNGLLGRIKYYFKSKRRRLVWLFIVIILSAMFIRVPQSVLAPASIIAKDPAIITVPMEGVIENIAVMPEQYVRRGEILFDMDKRDLVNANELAQKELATATAKYKTAVQSSYQDIEKRAEIQVLQAQMQEKALEVNYTRHLIEESYVRSTIDGIAIIDTPNQWIGKPVVTGENVMQVAIPNQIEIEIWLPVSDAINFQKGDKVKLFLNADPLNPVYGIIEYSSFEATITPSQVLAYQVIAYLDSNQSLPKIGSQGTAKLMGENVSLFYYLFRKPITTLRQFFGW